MPNTFIQLGTYFLNLDLVIGVELIPDPNDESKTITARVHFTTGKKQDFTDSLAIQSIASWLKSHKAT